MPDVEKLPFGDARFLVGAASAAFKKSAGTSQFVDWAACGVLNRSKMVLSGDVPSNCSLASFRHARFFDFFNLAAPDCGPPAGCDRPRTTKQDARVTGYGGPIRAPLALSDQ